MKRLRVTASLHYARYRGIELTEEAEAAGVTRHERGYEAAKIHPATGYGVGGAAGGGCGWRCWGRDVAGDVVGGEILWEGGSVGGDFVEGRGVAGKHAEGDCGWEKMRGAAVGGERYFVG